MTIELQAARSIVWARPSDCPAKLETLRVHTGNDEGGLALEVAVANWNGTESPSRDSLLKLHRNRVGNGIHPVVVVAVSSDKAWVLGPNPQAAVIGPLALEHAQRVLQSALSESSGLDARRSLNQTYEAIAATAGGGNESDALRGVGNAGLFATHELRHGVRKRTDWAEACRKSKEALSLRKTELIKKLGYSLEDVGGNASLLKSKGDNARAVAVILLDNETFDGQSNRFAVSPVAFGLQVADRKEVSWLIVMRKDAIRLYPARLDLGVGRKGLAETYFELNLAVADDSTAGFLSLIFSADALAENGSCYEILKSSAQYAVGLSARLRDNVYGEIVPRLSLAVAAQLPKLGVPMDREGLNRAYQITLRIFFRMLFQAYADDRKLLPYGENDDYSKNAIKGFAKKLIDEEGIEFDDESSSYWDDLIQVWRAIDTGSKRFGIPAYNGGLFSSDEELQPEGALIERLRLTDDIVGPVLRALLIDSDDDGTVGPIDFRSLSVREFGTIYEGLLESNLGLADTDLILDDKDTWIPAPKGAKLVPGRSAKKGTVYFHDTSGARKGTGSYFTPSFVVEHLLERSLDPALDAHLERVRAVLESGDQVGASDLFFDFKVADLAMGSAHFLTAAIDHIEQRMAGFLDMHPIPGVTNELRRLEEAAKEKLGENASVPEPSSLLRRQIARRCIYGLDINPVAVELARVSIWIHTFVRGLPMSSLDHTLVCANSLTGIGTVDEALNVLVPGRKTGQITLFDDAIEEALTKARDVLVEVAKVSELDSKESKAASRATMKARKDAEEAKLLFDAAVLTRIGRGGLVAGSDATSIAKMANSPAAQSALEPLQPAHMPLLFPEVFLRENGGFEVLIGNPPWEEVVTEELKFWTTHIPGLKALKPGERTKRVEAIRVARRDLVAQYEEQVEADALVRKCLLAGPFPDMGTGDPDLYKAFAWRTVQLLSNYGRAGVVLPRTAFTARGSTQWRSRLISERKLGELTTLVNSANWVFKGVDPRYQVALAVLTGSGAEGVLMQGPYFELSELLKEQTPFRVTHEEISLWSETCSIPALGSQESVEIFTQMANSPTLGSHPDFEYRPVAEVSASLDRAKFYFETDRRPDGALVVYGGKSFDLWNPDTGQYFGWARPATLKEIQTKRHRQVTLRSSAFYGLGNEWANNDSTLPYKNVRIAFRDITRATDSRTVRCALVPPNVILNNKAPYLFRVRGNEVSDAFLLGVMSSIVFDWQARQVVELGLNPSLLQSLRVPESRGQVLAGRLAVVAATLANVGPQFASWATLAGARNSRTRTEPEIEELLVELDALVAHLFGLNREHVEHIFKTFHRGWDYQPRLTKVLEHFDRITKDKK